MDVHNFIKNPLNRKWLIAGGVLVGLIIILVIVVITLNIVNRNSSNSNTSGSLPLEGLGDDSDSALTRLTQKYDLLENEPTYDLYGEVGYQGTDASYAAVQTQSDFSPESEDCYPSHVATCLNLGREKTVMPNHSTVNINASSYVKSFDEKSGLPDGLPMKLNAYALLPEGSLVALSGTKAQFNFYDNETRVVQMSGSAYYRVKPQEKGKVFTIQAGDRLIEVDNAEVYIEVSYNKEDTLAQTTIFNNQKVGVDISKEEYEQKAGESRSKIYDVLIYVTSGSSKLYSRADKNTVLTELTEENPYLMFKFKDYGKRGAFESSQEESDGSRKGLASNDSFLNHLNFSMVNYGLGNFSNVSQEDLVKMLLINFDTVELQATRYALWYRKDLEDLSQQWNTLVQKMSSCNPGWYKTSTGGCCPDGFASDPTTKTCTKTTYYYYCDAGYTLGSDNKCYSQDKSRTQTPTYNPGTGAGGGLCVDKSKPASFQLCKMGTSVGTAKMSGSKCCFNEVASPTLESIK